MLDENEEVGIPWWSSGYDSTLSPPRAQVQSLVGKLRSHKPQSAAKKKIFLKKKKHYDRGIYITLFFAVSKHGEGTG